MKHQELLAGFHAFWDALPVQARLIRKDRTVVAVNPAGAAAGATAGIRCCDEGKPARHAGCLAQAAMEAGEARWAWNTDASKLRFWLPVAGSDCYVHFSLTKDQVEKGNFCL